MCDYMKKDLRQNIRQLAVKEYLVGKTEMKDAFAREEQVQTYFVDEAQMSQDAVSVGEKKTWKPSEIDKKRNEEIDKARTLTKRATKDTNYIHQTIFDLKTSEIILEDEEAFALLYSTKFNMHMLASSNIRKHFAEYMHLIRAYEQLKEQVGEDDPYGYRERLAPLQKNMETLTARMKAYTEQNRVHLDGTVLKDDEKASEFHVDRERILRGDLFTETPQPTYDETQMDSLDADYVKTTLTQSANTYSKKEGFFAENENLSDMLKKTLQELEVKDIEDFADPRPLEEIKDGLGPDNGIKETVVEFEKKHFDNPAGRIADIVNMRAEIHMRANLLKELENDEDMRELCTEEEIQVLKRSQIEMKSRLILAEAEARLFLAKEEKDEERIKQAKNEVKDAWEDYCKVKLFNAKETMPVTSASDESELMNKNLAMTSKSDRKNFKFKKGVLTAADKLDDPTFSEVKKAARAYALATHYSVGCEKEGELLRQLNDAIRQVSGPAADNPQLGELKKLLTDLNKTTIPKFDAIPASLKLDFSEQRLKESGGSVFDKGYIRNYFMNNDHIREWKDMRNVPLFPHEPTINDLRQGKISNCYMLAATTSLINMDPQAIKHCVRDDGDYAIVRLYKGPGRPVYIRVKKEIPVLKTGGLILTSGPLWMQMIEMAAAQVGKFQSATKKGVQSLWYSNGADWLAMLTGVFEKEIMYEQGKNGPNFNTGIRDADGIFAAIRDAKAHNEIYHMGTKSSTTAGLNSGHAYTVLGAKQVGDKKYITLRNPYANMSYTHSEKGEEAMTSSYFSSVADATCGQFDIPLDEFLANAQSVTKTVVNPNDINYFPEEKEGITLQDVASNGGQVPGTELKSELKDMLEEEEDPFAEIDDIEEKVVKKDAILPADDDFDDL